MRKIRYPRVDDELCSAVRQEAEPAQRQWPAAGQRAPPHPHTPDSSREQQVTTCVWCTVEVQAATWPGLAVQWLH